MARLSLSFLLLLSLLSFSVARFQPQPDNLLPRPDTESEPNYLPQLEKLEPESETASLPELPNHEPEEKPEIAETVQYIVIPVHRFADVRQFENLQDIGFSLRLPIRHGHHHHHHHHRFGGFGHRFGHKFGHGFGRRFAGRENDMKDQMEMPEMEDPVMPRPMELNDQMEKREMLANLDKTEVSVEEDKEKMEKVREIMKKMRKCKHHRMEKGMRHMHHEHAPEQREEQPREEREDGGFIKQFWNYINGY